MASLRVKIVAGFIVLAIGAGCLAVLGFNKASKIVAYTMVSKETSYDSSGQGHEVFSEVKYVFSRGAWRSIKSFRNGFNLEQYAQKGRGIFTLDHQRRKMFFESPYNPGAAVPSGSNKNLVRSEIVAGFRTNVLRTGTSDAYVESFLAPDLNDGIIKTVIKTASSVRVIEPVTISVGEPPHRALQHSEYEVDNSRDKKYRIVPRP